MSVIGNIIQALRQRNVIRTTSLYAGAAWLVISIGDVALPLLDAPGWVFPAVIWAAVAGLPFAAVLAWFWQIGPSGVVRDHGTEGIARARSPLDLIVIGLLLGALSVSVYLNLAGSGGFTSAGQSMRDMSIAVLPFRDLSATGDQAYLADGIAEEVLNALARYEQLRVISRASSFSFRSHSAGLGDIAERLNVGHIIDGSIRKLGDVVRVTVQLIDTTTDANQWSLTYERSLTDVFALQDEIAADVSNELQLTMRAVRAPRQRVDPQAFELFMRARYLARQFNEASLARSNELLQAALELEPDYVDAWNSLSANYATQAGEGFIPALQGIEDSRKAAQKALSVAPQNSVALAGLGWIALRYDNDLQAAAKYLERALELDAGNAEVVGNVAALLFRMRRGEDALALAARVTSLDPLDAFGFANLGVYNLYSGKFDAAIGAYQRALELSPGFIGAHYAIALAHLLGGDLAAAMTHIQLEPDEEFRTKGTAMIHHAAGRTDEFDASLAALIEGWGHIWPSEVAEVYALAGDVDAAFAWIDKDIAGSQGMGWAEAVLNPVYRNLHDDPRWQTLLAGINLSPRQLASIDFKLPESLIDG